MVTYEVWSYEDIEIGGTDRRGVEAEGLLRDANEAKDYLRDYQIGGYEKTYDGIRLNQYVSSDDMLPNGDTLIKTFHFTTSKEVVEQIIEVMDL